MIEEKIKKIVGSSNYTKGKLINPNTILPQKTLTILGNDKILRYKVQSSNSDNLYIVELILKNGEIISSNCSCPMCEKTGSCKHIASVLINKPYDIFKNYVSEETKTNNNLDISKQILDKLYNKNLDKQELKLDIELHFESSYNRNGMYVILRVGINKMYATNSKVSQFLNAYKYGNTSVVFGKEFTYDKTVQTFNKEDSKILNFLCDIFYLSKYNSYSSLIFIEERFIDSFMKLLKNKTFSVYPYYTFSGYLEETPFESKLIKKEGKYIFSLEYDYLKFLDYSHKYIVYNDKLYRIPDTLSELIKLFNIYQTNTITFSKEDIPKFSESIGSIIDSTTIEEDIKDEFVMIIPKTLLYFDFDDDITCNIKFDYHNNIINYFDNTDILRNKTFENEVLKELLDNGFIISNKTISLKDLDDYDKFITETLPVLNQKYTIFTTEKFDKMEIKKETKISSHFSIGQDNIFKIDFDLDGINKDELKNIFDGITNNKKYYKLKNGSLLNLKDNKLNELKDLIEDIDIDIHNIDKEYTMPKYRAIYLDSLKENKYNIIKTNNLFDEFIDNFEKYRNISLDIDETILRNYQVTGVKWLYNIYKCGFGGILADEMGLGKSIQTIYLIKQVLREKVNSKILIVAPTSLIYNWENEFKKFGNELNFKVIAGTKVIRQGIFDNISNIDIIITTYGLVREDNDYYKNMDFELMIIDEAQNIKNPHALSTKVIKSIKSNVKLALTGTPLENSCLELWSIFDFIMPGYLNTLIKFNEKYSIKDVDTDALKSLDKLNLQISPFILRRKKKDVLTDLPPKIENNIYLDLGKEQKLIYLKEVKRTEKEMDEIIKTEGFLKARFKILSLITRLRQICIDPRIVYEDYKGESIKIDEICNTVKKLTEDNHKILIFTSYKSALEIVRKELLNSNINSYVIDGSVSSKKRNELVNNFNIDNTNVFLIMLKAGGTGLNLTGADTVIHLDLWWNPQAENQATDRAHRIGQKRSVQVIKFICKGTIEERILELQNKKKILSDTLIEGDMRDTNMLSSLNEDDFRKLLSYSDD